MKKNTLQVLFLLTFVMFSFSGNAQSKSNINQNVSSSVSLSSQILNGVQLNDDNQEFYNQNGFVRCLTTEMTEKYRNENSNSRTNQQFENWITPLLEEYKQNKAAQKASGTFIQATYSIPIIFHVIYDNEAEGIGPNLDAIYVNAQIDQLNMDFANQAGALSGPWAAVSADTDIQFVPAVVDPNGVPLAQAGINRVGGYAAPLDFDGVIKPATIWDRTQYANIWTGQLAGGLLGYAQFPDMSTLPGMPAGTGGAVNTDGVVCLYSSIGSVALPHPAGGIFASGRTLTHEVGHWIGLRHIWGDTDCSGDDFCDDTPLQGGANGSNCNLNNNSCPVVTVPLDRDMAENYMDYSYDTCMNIFTQDQVDRMIVVLTNSPGRTELPNSTVGNSGPSISFASTTGNQVEGSDCLFTDVVIGMDIGAAPSSNAVANLTVNGGTATDSSDFELMTSSVSFSAGITVAQSMILRIYNDSYVEGDETFTVGFTVNANGGDATAGNDSITFTITDDDSLVGASGTQTLFEDGFEAHTDFAIANVGQWSMIDNDGDATWGVDNTTFLNENYVGSFIVFNSQTTTPASGAGYAAHSGDKGFYCISSNGNNSGTAANDDYVFTPQVANVTGGKIKFWAKSLTDNYNGGERFQVGVSATNDGMGITYVTPNPYVVPPLDWTEYEYDIPTAFDNQNVYVTVHVVTVDEFIFMMDDFSITTNVDTGIQTSVNTTTNSQIQLKGLGTAYTVDSVSGDIMANIEISDASDYGCTDVLVSRSGTSGQSFNGSVAPDLVMDKSFTISPTTENATGTSTLSFYVTDAELVGWETVTSDSRANLQIGQLNGSALETVAATITPFGTSHKITGAFTSGLKGSYYFGNLALLSTSEFVFDGFAMYPNPTKTDITIRFNTTSDVSLDLFDIRGRLVFNNSYLNNGSKFEEKLNVSNLTAGIYVVKLKSGKRTMFRKLVIK